MVSSNDEFRDLSYLDAPKILVSPPGPKTTELLRRQAEVDSRAVYYPTMIQVAWESGKGATLRDVDGNTYVDFVAGIAVLNVGHSNPHVVQAVKRQLDNLVHVLDVPTEQRIQLVERLTQIAPCGLRNNSKALRRIEAPIH